MGSPAIEAMRGEYHRYRRLCELALEQIDDAALVHELHVGGNSIAVLLQHLAGNLKSRFTDFLTSDGEKEWRQRDREFEPRAASRAHLLAAWQEAWSVVDAALDELQHAGDAALERHVTIRGQPLTVLEALTRSVAHVAYHAGQIVLLARERSGDAWRSLSIPRGTSQAYRADPTRERSPDGR